MKYLYLTILLIGAISCNNLKTESAPTEPEIQKVAKVSPKHRKSKSDLEGLTEGAGSFMRNKNISRTTKGAVVGAGVGAVTGAIISKKNPGRGAIVGGAIGAGAGALTGRISERKPRKRLFKNGLFGRRNRD